jgi:hypothetical protein
MATGSGSFLPMAFDLAFQRVNQKASQEQFAVANTFAGP